METTYVNSSELGIESSGDSTVVELLKGRHTHTKWLNRPVEDYKREQILKAAYLAPSKQSSKPYTIMPIGDSETGRRIKNDLFTKVCIAEPLGWRGGDYGSSTGDRPTNGQMRAPLVLAFGFRPVQFQDLPSSQRESLFNIEDSAEEMLHTYHKEVMFAAMCSIITAESLGLQTGCVACIMNQSLCLQTLREVYPYHDDPQAYVSLFIGIGYSDGASQSTGVDIKPSFNSIVRPLI